METLGKSLVFYLKYINEMEAFYENEDYTALEGISNQEEIIEKINAVAEKAYEQVTAFLLKCIERSKDTFAPHSDVYKYEEAFKRTAKVTNNWYAGLFIYPKRKQNPKKLQAGFSLAGSSLRTYLWVPGGASKQKLLTSLLSEHVVEDTPVTFHKGSVIIGNFDILELAADRPDIETDILTKMAIEPLEALTKDELESIFKIIIPITARKSK